MKSKLDLSSTVSSDIETMENLNVTTDMDLRLLDGALSSTVALVIVLTIIFSLVMTSLLTFCFHKWKLRAKKLQRAQEEYQRDQEKNMSTYSS